MENFAENYYPKDFQTEKEKTEQKVQSPMFSPEMLLGLIGGSQNPFASLFKNENLQNNNIMQTFSSLLNNKTTKQDKSFDDEFYEEY